MWPFVNCRLESVLTGGRAESGMGAFVFRFGIWESSTNAFEPLQIRNIAEK